MLFSLILLFCSSLTLVQGSLLFSDSHRNSRCLCKCPDVDIVTKKSSNLDLLTLKQFRSIYIEPAVDGPKDCDCPSVVLTKVNMTSEQADSFCPRCKCKFEMRSLTVIQTVVILVLWVISILVVYMVFLVCVEPALNKKKALSVYREQQNYDGDSSDQEHQMTAINRGNSVINRVESQQTRWKRKVEEQRRNIYDRHSMLN